MWGEGIRKEEKESKAMYSTVKLMIPDPKCSPDHRLGSLLLYPPFCWSIREPLKNTVKCGLSGINNYFFFFCNEQTSVKTVFQDIRYLGNV